MFLTEDSCSMRNLAENFFNMKNSHEISMPNTDEIQFRVTYSISPEKILWNFLASDKLLHQKNWWKPVDAYTAQSAIAGRSFREFIGDDQHCFNDIQLLKIFEEREFSHDQFKSNIHGENQCWTWTVLFQSLFLLREDDHLQSYFQIFQIFSIFLNRGTEFWFSAHRSEKDWKPNISELRKSEVISSEAYHISGYLWDLNRWYQRNEQFV